MPTYRSYLRISTDAQDQASQQSQIQKWADAEAVTIAHTYHDTASGRTRWQDRQLAECLRDSTEGDVIVVSEISRIARSTLGVLSFLESCTECGVGVVAVQSRIVVDASIGSTIMVTVLALAAQIERDLLRERTTAALAARRAAGLPMGRPHGSTRPSMLAQHSEGIRQLLASGVSKRAIARVYSCSPQTLHNYLRAGAQALIDTRTLPLPGVIPVEQII